MELSRYDITYALDLADMDEDALRENVPYYGDQTRLAIRIENDSDTPKFFLGLAEAFYENREADTEDSVGEAFKKAREFADRSSVEQLGRQLYIYFPPRLKLTD